MLKARPSPGQSIRLATFGAFFAFFLFGFADSIKGPALPVILEDLKLGYAAGGALLFSTYAGFLFATLLAGSLCDRVGKRAVILMAGLSLCLGMAGFAGFATLPALMFAMILVGIGFGAFEVGGNTIIVDLQGARKGFYLNLLAVCHGAGSVLAPLFAGKVLSSGASWRSVYGYSLILAALLPLYFLFVRYPRNKPSVRNRVGLRKLGKTAFGSPMGLYYMLIAMYVSAEVATASWMVVFLQRAKGLSVISSSLFLSLFFGALTAGRLAGSLLVDRLGYLIIMLWASVAAALCLALGILAPAGFAFFLPLTGFFFSIIFPTTTAAVSDLHRKNIGTVLGLLFTFGGAGAALGPWGVGIVSDWLGIFWGFAVTLLFCTCVTIALLVLVIKRNANHSTPAA